MISPSVFAAMFFDDAEQVARIGAVGKSVRTALAVEDGDAVDDCVLGVAGDRDADVAFGVEEPEARELVVEEA